MNDPTTMCITEAIKRMNVLKDKAQSSNKWLIIHSMITTLYILKEIGFERVKLEVYDVSI